MSEQLHAINIMRKRLDKKLQMYWSEMFALKYEASWTANMQARTIFEYGQSLIAFCHQINVLTATTANQLRKAWNEAYDKHKEMRHCREAKVVHPRIPEVNTEGVLSYFLQGAENQCNNLLLSIRTLKAEAQTEHFRLCKELETTIDCASDLQLINEKQATEAYSILMDYYINNYTEKILNFTQ